MTLAQRPRSRGADFLDEVHVYEPHRAGLPPLDRYVREVWRRRRFAYELSRTQLRTNHIDSPLGALWLVLNPLLLGLVYFVLTTILSRGKPPAGSTHYEALLHILIGLFTWYYAQNSMAVGATAVTTSGGLVLNQSFPRALLPIASCLNAFLQYLPTVPLYVALVVLGKALGEVPQDRIGAALLLLPVLLVLLSGAALGLALLLSTLTVYFRDTNKFLMYFLRIWLYLSPVLYPYTYLLKRHEIGKLLLYGNPLAPALGAVVHVWTSGDLPPLSLVVASALWAVVLLVAGGYVFVSRERDFAVRL